MEALPEDITDRIRSYTRENQGKVIFDEVLKVWNFSRCRKYF